MLNKKPKGWPVIAVSFILALMLTAMPLPESVSAYRPNWVAMVLIYWCMALPDRVGPGIGWILGLLVDVLQGTLLGANALGFSVIAYFVQSNFRRLRVYPLAQQSIVVGFYLFLYLLISLWIYGLTGDPNISWSYWMPIVTSALLWPWLFIILRDARRKFHMS